MKTNLSARAGLCWLAIALALPVAASPLGSAISYRGQLNRDGNAANGLYDLRVALYDDAIAGVQIGSTVITNGLGITNGLFAVALDFGAGCFDGNARWLEISVRTNGNGTFTTLVPRQALVATPYASYSLSAGNAQYANAAGAASGNGAGLTNLNGAGILPGTIPASAIAAGGVYPAGDARALTNLAAVTRVVNVKNYGATGVGNWAVDSPAIRAAFTAWTNGGGVLYFPVGYYNDTNSYVITAVNAATVGIYRPLAIAGDSIGSSLWRAQIQNGTFLACVGHLPDLRDISIVDVGSGANFGLSVTNNTGPVYWRNVRFRGFKGWGADIQGAASGAIFGGVFEDCTIGLRVSGFCDGWSGVLRLDRNIWGLVIGASAPSFPGILRANANRWHVNGNHNDVGVVIGGGSRATYVSGYMERCTNGMVNIGYPIGSGVVDDISGGIGPVELCGWSGVNPAGYPGIRINTNCCGLTVRNIGAIGDPDIHFAHASADATPLIVENTQRGVIEMSDGSRTMAGEGGVLYKNEVLKWLKDGTTDTAAVMSNGVLQVQRVIASGPVEVAGSFSLPSVTKTANYMAAASDYCIRVDTSNGNKIITLPGARTAPNRIYVVTKISADSNQLLVNSNSGGDRFNGTNSIYWTNQWRGYRLQSDGVANWYVLP